MTVSGVFGVRWRTLMSGVVALGASLVMLTGGTGSGTGTSVAPPVPPASVLAQPPARPPTPPAGPAVRATPTGLWFPVVEPATTRVVSTLVGGDGAGDTAGRFGVQGADLGHVFVHRGRLAVLFGDTYGDPPADPFFSVPHQDRRGSTLGWLDARGDLGPAIRLADMVTDRPGHAEELLSSQHVPGVEETVIPTAGLSTGARMWMHYMSVRRFEGGGQWTINASGMAYSDDDGHSWTRDPGATWPGTSRFGQVAFARSDGDPEVFVYGVPAGRYGPVSLARVPADRLGDRTAYRYYTAHGWSGDERDAADIVRAPVGELSIGYNSYQGRWLMMYLVDPTGEIMLRSALSPTGPWSAPQVVATTKDYPMAYAPAITPVWNDGPDVVFTLSRYLSYGVDLMRTRLALQPVGTPLPQSCATPQPGWPAPWWMHRTWPEPPPTCRPPAAPAQ